MTESSEFKYPRFRFSRRVIHYLTRGLLSILSDFRIVGKENFPSQGPLLVVGNHFTFLDPVTVIAVSPWPIEFVGGAKTPNAPGAISWLRMLYGYYPVYRGTGSTLAFRAAESIFSQNGVLGIFPEGSSANTFVRRARPGAALMAARAGVKILPMGFDGLTRVFPSLRRGKRAKVTVSIGKPIGPFSATGRGRKRREQLDEIGDTIMRTVADLLPDEQRGVYSSDPAVREVAEKTEAAYQWDAEPEV